MKKKSAEDSGVKMFRPLPNPDRDPSKSFILTWT